MHAMQYEIPLPADYDMGIIRHRVATRGSALDDFPGLGLKAYVIRERGVNGSPVNQYAPFYLWLSVEGMNRFLYGDGFRILSDDFGRPSVQHWTGLAFRSGPARETTPRAASRSTERLDPDADPAVVIEREIAALEERASAAGVHSAALAIDPRHWELLRFTLWEETAGTRYEVLHLSRPGIDDLTP